MKGMIFRSPCMFKTCGWGRQPGSPPPTLSTHLSSAAEEGCLRKLKKSRDFVDTLVIIYRWQTLTESVGVHNCRILQLKFWWSLGKAYIAGAQATLTATELEIVFWSKPERPRTWWTSRSRRPRQTWTLIGKANSPLPLQRDLDFSLLFFSGMITSVSLAWEITTSNSTTLLIRFNLTWSTAAAENICF